MKQELTPQQGLEIALEMFPDFQSDWDESLYRKDDGGFSLHTVFCEFTHYTRDKFSVMSEKRRHQLFDFVESCTRTEDEPYSNTDEAVCTCFLENLSGEPLLSTEMRQYMGENSRVYFDYWDGGMSLMDEG